MNDIFTSDNSVLVYVVGPAMIIWCIVQAVKAIDRARTERLIREAQQGVSGPAWSALEDLRHRVASDSDSLTNRIERRMDRMLSGRRS